MSLTVFTLLFSDPRSYLGSHNVLTPQPLLHSRTGVQSSVGFYYTSTFEENRQVACENASPLCLTLTLYFQTPTRLRVPESSRNQVKTEKHTCPASMSLPLDPFSDPQVFCYTPKTEEHRSGDVPTIKILQEWCSDLQCVSQEANSVSASCLELN